MKLNLVSLASLSLLLTLRPAFGEKLTLISPGGAPPKIVLANSAEDQERFAAGDLQKYLQKMTGQQISIVATEREGSPAIFIGNVPENADLVKIVKEQNLGRDGFVIDISSAGVRILGGSKFGTAYGVDEFLERLGVRWLFPGEWGEVVPEQPTIEIPLGQSTDHPVFSIREMHTASAGADVGEWFRRNRHNRNGFYGHSRLIDPKKYGQEHPEWYAEIDGKRDVNAPNFKLCHSNDAMTQQAIADTLAAIRQRIADTKPIVHNGYVHLAKDYSIISISPTDGGGFCRCDECLKMGTVSDRLQIFANRIAQGVRKEFPNYSVGYYGAYSEAQDPPTVKAIPGVVVFATTWTRDFFLPITAFSNEAYLKKLEAFIPVCPDLALRDFDGLAVWWGYGPFSLAGTHAQDYQWYANHGIRGVITEAQSGWGPWGYSYYLMGKLWWNPFADLDALKRDFVRSAYGEAYEPMRRYYDKLDEAKVYPPPAVLYSMRKDLEDAAFIAKRPDVQRRIDYLRAYYFQLDLWTKQQSGQGTSGDAVLIRRLSHSIDPSVSPFTDRVLDRYLPASKGTEIAPFTAPELRDLLNTVKLEKPLDPLATWSDRDDLRLVPLNPEKKEFPPSLGMNLRYGPATILIHAEAGEQIHVTQAWKRSDPFSTVYELRDPDQGVAAQGIAKGEEILDKVAGGTGIYTLTLSPGGPYPEIFVSNRFVVLKAGDAHQRVQPMGKVPETYFYVPKDTKEFAITTKAFEPLTVQLTGPDGKVGVFPKIVQSSQQFVEHRIQVPPGADGGVWKMELEGGKKEMFLTGIPPFFASAPERLLVPPPKEP